MLRTKRIGQVELVDISRTPAYIQIQIGRERATITRHDVRSAIDWLTRWLESTERNER